LAAHSLSAEKAFELLLECSDTGFELRYPPIERRRERQDGLGIWI
jgi:hypothetical protein